MIRTLVVDDDFRVARIHAASVDARNAVTELHPDLMPLDIYLPDEDGLSQLRSLHAATEPAPDCIVITAARDLQTVRSAIQVGAVYYLVKPFGFAQLRSQLETYRRSREHLATVGEADQATVDNLYGLLRTAPGPATRRRLTPTMQKILDTVRAADVPLGASEVAHQLGMSRPTAQRYLTELERRGLL